MPFMRKATDAPFGFIPHGPVLRVSPYRKLASYGTAIYPGDTVIQLTAGDLNVGTTSSTTCVGVAATYSAASTADTVMVYDHPHQLFMVQDDSDTAGMTSASPGALVNVLPTAGSTSTFRSLMELDSSTLNTTQALVMKVVAIHPVEGPYATAFATAADNPRRWIVQFNQHMDSHGVGKTGI